MPDIRFLYHEHYNEAIKAMIEDSSDLRIAVSYWGKRINEKLGLIDRVRKDAQNIQIICDLGHIACRHEPIDELLRLGVPLKRIERLHAKVWITDSQMIVGSANSSRSALHMLEQTSKGNDEAGICITDKKAISEAINWFSDLWCDNNCIQVSPKDIKKKIEKHSEKERSKTENSRCPFYDGRQKVTFEYFVGRENGRVFRERLDALEIERREKGNLHTLTYEKIRDVENIAEGLIEALRVLVRDDVRVLRDHKKQGDRVLHSFNGDTKDKRTILLRQIQLFVDRYRDGYLWLEKTEAGGFSLRLAHSLPSMGHIALLTLTEDRISLAQDRYTIV